tara:strand:- start:4421 stop:5125 length:705 start_codon:yes stop_codon:yes gene_type:complete
MLPKAIYEVLPYIYLFTALGLLAGHSDWIVLGFAWLLYTGAAITWVLRSDARRVNPRRPKERKDLFLHDDFYESMPFFYLGGGLLVMRFLDDSPLFYAGLIIFTLGIYVLGIRINKRKISWIDDWRRYRGSAVVAKKVYRKKMTSQICDQCLIRESCRGTGLSDKSNIRIMSWLNNEQNQDQDALVKLRWELDEVEFSPLSEERLLKVLHKSRQYHKHCLVLLNRRKIKLVSSQ